MHKEVGGFEIVSQIGKGAMGAVFKARQKSLDRIVALKILPPKIAENKAFIQRFVREARASAKLSHPNVVAGIDVGQDEATDVWYFAMELVEGPSARQLLKKKGRLSEDEALRIAKDIAEALDCAHRNRIVHRDVKPDNILLTKDGTAKLADLGLARHQQDDAALTQSGAAMGTPFYMAPELVRGEVETLDTRTDLYGLGATLFHLVTGRPPFDGETSAVTMSQHLNDPPPVASRVCPDVSMGCSRLILALMQKDRKKRPQTPKELIERIERLLQSPAGSRDATTGTRKAVKGKATTGARSPVGGTTTSGRTTTRPRARMEPKSATGNPAVVYAAIGVGVLLLLGIVALMSSTGNPQPRQQTRKPDEPVVPSVISGGVKADVPTARIDDASIKAKWKKAQAYAKQNPEDYEEILKRFKDVAVASDSTRLSDEVKAASAAVEKRYEEAAQKAWQTAEKKIDQCAAANDYDAALVVLDALPPRFAPRLTAQAKTKRDALTKEANAKAAPVLEKAQAALRDGDPAAGLAALNALASLKFKPVTARVAELKRRFEHGSVKDGDAGAPKDRMAAEKKLSALLKQFDSALLEQKDEKRAARVVREAKTAKDLAPVQAEVNAMEAILGAAAAERKRQEEAAKGLKGRAITIGENKGTVDRVADGKLFIQISMDGGKGGTITAIKEYRIADLRPEQQHALFPPPAKVPAALTVRTALHKLAAGPEHLMAAETLLKSVPDFPLTPRDLDLIKVERKAAMEVMAEAAWAELAAEAKKPLAKNTPAFRDKVQAFVAEFGETAFAKGKANELVALRSVGSFKDWSHGIGTWELKDQVLAQTSRSTDCRTFAPSKEWTDYIYTVEARKVSGGEGFLILFRVEDKDHFYWWNIGGWNNTAHALETRPKRVFERKKGRVATGRWYQIKIKVEGSRIECYLDGELTQTLTDDRYPSGGIGLGSWLTSVEYRNVSVTTLDGKTILYEVPALGPAEK